MRIRRFSKDKRGIDTIIATLLMVVIVVIASVMVFTYATGLLGALLIAPKTATENISLEYTFYPNNTAATIYVRNIGSTPITFTSYYVKDSTGNQYARLNWGTSAPPALPPTALAPGIAIVINSSVCTLTGAAFTFQSGNAYTLTLVTSRNTSFSMSILA